MKTAVVKALADYNGDEIILGVLSAWDDTPVQNKWIASMEEERVTKLTVLVEQKPDEEVIED